jgi:hypothetical protein
VIAELGRKWNEARVAYFMVLSQENHENFIIVGFLARMLT